MSSSKRSPLRPLAVGAVAGLIIGCLFGWLAIGWKLWPVKYVGDAYTYDLNEGEKLQYVAAVVDSYNLRNQIELVQPRFTAWTVEEKVTALAQLFAEYQVQGQMQEAEKVLDLALGLKIAEGWDPAIISQATGLVAQQLSDNGAVGKAQFVTMFSNELGAPATVPSAAPAPATRPETRLPLGLNTQTLLPVCGGLLALLLVLIIILSIRRRSAARKRPVRVEPEWTGAGPPPLVSKRSGYTLGMDNFDESFAIETADNEWLGEFGMGISEVLGQDVPKRIAAFEVWLFDKANTLTITKVLMTDFAYNDEKLRAKLAARGEPILAMPGVAFTLETPALTVEAQVVEMHYGDGQPDLGYFNNLSVALNVFTESRAGTGGDRPAPGMGIGVS